MTTTNMESVREITAEQMELIAGAGPVAPLAPNPYESTTAGAVAGAVIGGDPGAVGAASSGGAARLGAQMSGPGRLAPNPYQ
jgi:hypothetical protein